MLSGIESLCSSTDRALVFGTSDGGSIPSKGTIWATSSTGRAPPS